MLIGVLSALFCPKLGLQGGAGDPADHVALGLPVRHLGVPRDPGRDRAPVRVAVRVLWWDVLMLCLCCACAVCGLCIAPPTSPSGTRVNSMATSTLVWDQFHASNSSAPPPHTYTRRAMCSTSYPCVLNADVGAHAIRRCAQFVASAGCHS